MEEEEGESKKNYAARCVGRDQNAERNFEGANEMLGRHYFGGAE